MISNTANSPNGTRSIELEPKHKCKGGSYQHDEASLGTQLAPLLPLKADNGACTIVRLNSNKNFQHAVIPIPLPNAIYRL